MKRKAVTLQLEGEIPQSQSAYDLAVEDGYEGSEEQYGKELATIPPTQEQFDAIPGRVCKLTNTTEKSDFHHITDSAADSVLDFGMEGKTEQKTTSGKNYYSGGDVSGVGIVEVNVDTIPAGTYVISANVTSEDTAYTESLVSFMYDDDSGIVCKLSRGTRTSKHIILAQDANKIIFRASNNTNNSAGLSFSFTDVQVELDDGNHTATDYEPYTNGPSPNPDYPQEIVNAGVYNEATGRYEHKFTVGNKNWLSVDMLVDGVVLDAMGNYSYKDGYCATEVLRFPIGQWTLSCQNTDNTIVLVAFDSSGKRIKAPINGKISQKTFTISDDTAYVRFGVHKSKEVAESMNIQLEYNGSQTDYTPHASQPLTLTSDRPITMWDKLVKRDGVWGWSIWSDSGIFDGSSDELWTRINSSNEVRSIIRTNSVANKVAGKDNILCSHFWRYNTKYPTNYHLWLQTELYNACSGTNSAGQVYFSVSPEFTTIDEWREWLVENPITLVWETSTEQSFHPLPDEEQELLHNLETYYGVTNLYNDQGCPMWLTYVQDTKIAVDNKFNNIKQALLSLGANV